MLTPAAALPAVPDAPRLVEARGMILAGRGHVTGEAGGLVIHCDEERLAVSVGCPDDALVVSVASRAAPGWVWLAPPEDRERHERLLRGWRGEIAIVHTPTRDFPPPGPGVRPLAAEDPMHHVPLELRDELEAARRRSRVFAAFVGAIPVAFAYAPWATERWFDVAVDTLAPWRRRGHAAACALALFAAEGAAHRRPVWGAVESNAASLALARALGFVAVDRLVVYERDW
jgi:hypothetical protein